MLRDVAPLFSAHRGIVLAADVDSIERLESLAQVAENRPQVVALKVGVTLALRIGLPRVVSSARRLVPLPIIYDHQKAGTDVPEMGKPFAQACAEAGVDAIILFPHAGPRTLEAFVSAAFDVGLIPIVGLEMTHPAYLQSQGGFMVDSSPDTICTRAVELGVTHFVVPGTKINVIRRFAARLAATNTDSSILAPGVGRQGGSLTAVVEAARPLNAYPIIGSAVYAAESPQEALLGFVKELEHAAT